MNASQDGEKMTTNDHPFTLRSEVPPPPCTCDYNALMAEKRQEKGPTKAKKAIRLALHNMALESARFCDRHRDLWLRARRS